jgi:hypothetical protein
MVRIERAFAEATAEGRYDRAAGWFAVARWYAANAWRANTSGTARGVGSHRARRARPLADSAGW